MGDLGIIEGFYGKPWSWEERAASVAFLAPRGFTFHLYAPKADPYLRRRWREPHPDGAAEAPFMESELRMKVRTGAATPSARARSMNSRRVMSPARNCA